MVQDNGGEVRQSIVDRLRRLLRGTRMAELQLDFTINVDDKDHNVVDIYMTVDGNRSKVKNIRELWNYGFSVEKNNVRYTLSDKNLKTLLAIKSMNPEVTEDGTIISDVYPKVLNYLRQRENISEDQASKRIKVQDLTLKHLAKVSYDPAEGMHVKAGYDVPGHDGVAVLDDMKKSPDEEYLRFEDSFYRVPDENPRVKAWVETQDNTIGLDKVPEFFKQDLVLLKSNFNAVLTDQAKDVIVVDERLQPRVKVDTDERGWLDFEVDYKAGEYELSHDLFKNSKSGYVHPNENTWIRVDRNVVNEMDKQIEVLDAEKTDKGYRIPVTRFLSLEDAIEHMGGIRQVSDEYQHFLDEIKDFKYDPKYKLPPEYESYLISNGVTLRPYQRAGIHWLNWLTSHHLHGVLADDMGLGKTIQTIIAMKLAYESTGSRSHSLVVCPKSVVGHWTREIKRVYPNISVYEYVGQSRDSHRLKAEEPIIFVTTYDILSRDIEALADVPFFFVILDEGTRIKNPETRRSIAAKTLNAAHRLVLSGTPIENRPAELWSIFDFLMKSHLGTYGGFISNYERPIQENEDKAADMLAKRIKPFILRRLKEDVAKDLPEKIEMDYWCELTEEQKSLYGQLQEMYVTPVRAALEKGEDVDYTTSIFPILIKLKQLCDHPALVSDSKEPILGRSEKFDLIVEMLRDIANNDESVVVFSHFLGTLDLLESQIKDNGINYIRIDGSTKNRQELIDRFNKGKAFVALCSLMAAGHGINLTAANHVIHVDRWWNPAVEDQATDRVHRLGQTNTVYVHKVLTKGTLEEKIDTLIEKKRGISDRVITPATKGVKGWTREELLGILKPIEE